MAATVIYLTEIVPAATESSMGTVRINTANGLTISDGRLGARLATTSQPGTVRPDGTTITIDEDGTIRGGDAVPVATTSVAGKVRPDGMTIFVSGGVISTRDYGRSIEALARRIAALEEALGIEGGTVATVSGRTLSLSGATVSDRTLSVTGASVSGRTLSFGRSGGTGASVSDGTMTLSGASVSGRTLSVPGGSVSGSELQF